MRKDDSWGGNLELRAIADLEYKNIRLLDAKGDLIIGGEIKASFDLEKAQEKGYPSKDWFELVFHNNHYESAKSYFKNLEPGASPQEPAPKRVFSMYDEKFCSKNDFGVFIF